MFKKIVKFLKKNKFKGSGILVVIITALVFMIYSTSTYSEQEHYELLQKKYEDDIINYYNKDINNIDDVYDDLINNMTTNTNNISVTY